MHTEELGLVEVLLDIVINPQEIIPCPPDEEIEFTYLADALLKYPLSIVHFELESGYFEIKPHSLVIEIPLWYHNLRVPLGGIDFVFHLTRGGIVDSSYQITRYIYRDNKLIAISKKELIHLLALYLVNRINLKEVKEEQVIICTICHEKFTETELKWRMLDKGRIESYHLCWKCNVRKKGWNVD